jgi:hypothetical protein
MRQSRLLQVRRHLVGIALHVLTQLGNPRAFEPMNGIFGIGVMAINRHG